MNKYTIHVSYPGSPDPEKLPETSYSRARKKLRELVKAGAVGTIGGIYDRFEKRIGRLLYRGKVKLLNLS